MEGSRLRLGGGRKGSSQQISIPQAAPGGLWGWRDELSRGGGGRRGRTSAGIMITVSGRYEEQTLSRQPHTHTHTESRARLSLLGDTGVAHTGSQQ